jgi:hypothetical protein
MLRFILPNFRRIVQWKAVQYQKIRSELERRVIHIMLMTTEFKSMLMSLE